MVSRTAFTISIIDGSSASRTCGAATSTARGKPVSKSRPRKVIRCESRDGRQRFCRVPGGLREANIERRISNAGCDYGYSWGFRRDGVWVDRGCRADFVVF